MVKNLPTRQVTSHSIPGSGRSPGEGHSNPLQYSFLEKSMDRGAWWTPVHRIIKDPDRTEQLTLRLCCYTHTDTKFSSHYMSQSVTAQIPVPSRSQPPQLSSFSAPPPSSHSNVVNYTSPSNIFLSMHSNYFAFPSSSQNNMSSLRVIFLPYGPRT